MPDSGDDTPPQNIKGEVGATTRTIKLQQFWLDNAKTWFNMAELQFQVTGIKKDNEKFVSLLSALSPQACEVVSDIMANPPTENLYETMKSALLARLTPSDEAKLETLLSQQNLGDRRPSEALRHIQQLAGTQVSTQIIKSLWVRRLPEVIKIALLTQPDTISLNDLAVTADKLHAALSSTNQNISAVTRQSRSAVRTDSSRQPTAGTSQSATIEDRLAKIETRLNQLSNSRSRSRGRQQTQSGYGRSSNSRSPSNRRQYDKCWYHWKFGPAARKCVQPCNFNATSTSSMDVDVNAKNETTNG